MLHWLARRLKEAQEKDNEKSLDNHRLALQHLQRPAAGIEQRHDLVVGLHCSFVSAHKEQLRRPKENTFMPAFGILTGPTVAHRCIGLGDELSDRFGTARWCDLSSRRSCPKRTGRAPRPPVAPTPAKG